MKKHSVLIAGHKTNISLEDQFWSALLQIARGRELTVSEMVAIIKLERAHGSNLSSAIRLFVLDHYRSRNRSGG
jgi:predicted DNA-binding ribbon-helix-helix protein